MNLEKSIDTLARTIWAEARGNGQLGMGLVANVIMNRVNSTINWWGHDIISVCRKKWQFSCWNENDPNLLKLLNVTDEDVNFADALYIARLACTTGLVDYTMGADHYFVTDMATPPKWAEGKKPVMKYLDHSFYKLN